MSHRSTHRPVVEGFCWSIAERLGIFPRQMLDQRFEIAHERGIRVGDCLSSVFRTPDLPVRRHPEWRTFHQPFQSGMNGAARHPGLLGNGRDAFMPQNLVSGYRQSGATVLPVWRRRHRRSLREGKSILFFINTAKMLPQCRLRHSGTGTGMSGKSPGSRFRSCEHRHQFRRDGHFRNGLEHKGPWILQDFKIITGVQGVGRNGINPP